MSVKDLSSLLSQQLGWDTGLSDEIADTLINAKSSTDLNKLISDYIPPENQSLRDTIHQFVNSRPSANYFGANVKINYKNKQSAVVNHLAVIVNCLRCGKVQKQTKESQACNFCNRPLTEGRGTAAREATDLRDRLVQFDREAAKRTSVIDDQSDFFAIDSNAWLSDEERELLRRQQEEADRALEQKRKNIVVTIDLLGRRVIVDNDDEDMHQKTGGDLDGNNAMDSDAGNTTTSHGDNDSDKKDLGKQEQHITKQRIIACPSMSKYSIQGDAHKNNPFAITKRKKAHNTTTNTSNATAVNTKSMPRLQHDIVELLPDDLFD